MQIQILNLSLLHVSYVIQAPRWRRKESRLACTGYRKMTVVNPGSILMIPLREKHTVNSSFTEYEKALSNSTEKAGCSNETKFPEIPGVREPQGGAPCI